MAKKAGGPTPMNLTRISLGIFLILLGVLGVVPNLDESVFSLQQRYTSLEVLFGIVELICGLFILISLLTVFTRKIKYQVSVVIFVLWAARILISKLVLGFTVNSRGIFFSPNMGTWLLVLSCELIILSCLWMNLTFYKD